MSCRRKEPLLSLCQDIQVRVPKNATLERLRRALLDYWYVTSNWRLDYTKYSNYDYRYPPTDVEPGSIDPVYVQVPVEEQQAIAEHHGGISDDLIDPLLRNDPPPSIPQARERTNPAEAIVDTSYDDDTSLLHDYYVDGANAEDVLGFDDDDDGEEYGDMEEDEVISDSEFTSFQRDVRMHETKRAEANRRPGGIKTQKGVVKAWQVRLIRVPLD